ncbi:PilW family protein [Oceanobacter mangrovi]|uniref:PilW family protein n=1 Tax=Oceanobacter mangrovi TaxID=2862510 RepID=UPI001C8E2EAE|nr:PilW family protein [Oceanobacter mangrovi]
MSLIELMIAGAISIIIGLVVMQLMIGSNRSANRLDGMAQAQENARFSITWLSQNIRHGGYHPNIYADTIPAAAKPCTSNLIPPADNADCAYEDTANTKSGDRLAIRRVYEAGTGTSWDQTTCTGTALSTYALDDDEIVVDVYWVEADSDPTNIGDDYDDVLRCATYRESTGTILGSTQSIASGVESMQVLFTEPGAGNSASEYIRGNQITSTNSTDMSDVTAVRIAILARAFSDAAQLDGSQSYILLDAAPLVFDDGIPRQIMETTVFFPNRPVNED